MQVPSTLSIFQPNVNMNNSAVNVPANTHMQSAEVKRHVASTVNQRMNDTTPNWIQIIMHGAVTVMCTNVVYEICAAKLNSMRQNSNHQPKLMYYAQIYVVFETILWN